MQESWRRARPCLFFGVNSEYTIRRCDPSDAARIAEVGARLFTQAYGPTHPEPWLTPYLAKSFAVSAVAEALGDPRVVVLVVEARDGSAIGYAHTITRLTEFPDHAGRWPVTEIERFYVEAAWHGRGIAQELMAACVAVATERDAVRIFLQVWQEAPRAIAFYQRAGFVVAGETTFHFGPRVDSDFVMVRALRALAAIPGETH